MCLKILILGLPWWSSGYEYTCHCRGHGFDSWSRKIPHALEQLSPCAWTTEPTHPKSTWPETRERESESLLAMSDSLRPRGLYSPWNSPDQNTGMGILSLLKGILPTQGSNPGLSNCRWILYQLSQREAPETREATSIRKQLIATREPLLAATREGLSKAVKT